MIKRKTRGIVHRAEAGQTRVLADTQLLDYLRIQKVDQLLAHQYCVRRLNLQFSDVGHALQEVRTRIDAVLAETPLNNEDRFFIGKKVTAAARCLRALDSRRLRSLAAEGRIDEFRVTIERELKRPEQEAKYPILCYLADEILDEICETLIRGCVVVDEIDRELNFLDYYDPFALTCRVSGKSMLTHYLASKAGKHSVWPWATHISPEHRWLHTFEAQLDEEMAGIVIEYAYQARRLDSNVRIFGHNQHSVYVNGSELKNYLFLAVPVDQTPTQIDGALREFRSALVQAFVEVNGCYANVSSPDFDGSLFMRNFDDRVFLISEAKQVRHRLSGLWMWDLVNPSDGGGLTVSKALDRMAEEAEEQLEKLSCKDMPYDYSSYQNQYDDAVAEIGLKPQVPAPAPKQRSLDKYLTSSSGIVGRRQRPL